MPTPRTGESREDFVQRCIPIVIGDGTAEDGTQAAAICHSLFDQKENNVSHGTYLIENFANVTPGDPIRLFPFGKLHKGKNIREITSHVARQFKLPHFKPPIKLGSHDDTTPAGGYLVGLEIRDDGLYARPEYTDKGMKALEEGDYRYYSPEIIWEDQAIQDPETGDFIEGPLVAGVALLHTPHLGEAAALFTVDPLNEDKESDMDAVSIPLDKLREIFTGGGNDPKEPEPQLVEIVPEDYEATKARVEELEAEKAERLEADAKAETLAAIRKEFDTEEFGLAFVELAEAEDATEMLSRMDDEARAWVMGQFKALSAQIDESKLTEERGSEGDGDLEGDPDAVIRAYMDEHSVGYIEAFDAVRASNPEIFKT